VQVPQFVTVRIAPQLSGPVNVPHALPSRVQNAESASGTQAVPHTLGVPPPPHVIDIVHVPQFVTVRIAPQLSVAVTLPHVLLSRAQKTTSDSFMQPSIGPASPGLPAELPPTPLPPTPAPDIPPVVGEPPEPALGPDPDIPPVVSVTPPEPPEFVPVVVLPGVDPAAPAVGSNPPPELASRPGSAPSTPCAQDAVASAATTIAKNPMPTATRIDVG
jgi:hypothetical protein